MFLFILYKTHRVQSTLTIYTIYQGCYSSRKLTPPPSQQSTTASSFSVEEEAHQSLFYPFWNVYWLRLVQKKQQMLWAHEFTSIFTTEDTLYPQPLSQSTSAEMWGGVGGQKNGSKCFFLLSFYKESQWISLLNWWWMLQMNLSWTHSFCVYWHWAHTSWTHLQTDMDGKGLMEIHFPTADLLATDRFWEKERCKNPVMYRLVRPQDSSG